MTPFMGVGVNITMADTLDLAKALITRKDSITAKLVSDRKNILIT
jgi:2-polyprenyl-6-methoxyphenol hydroxylase-like FAD-dependent oxidoreductase